MSVIKTAFGKNKKGEAVSLYTIDKGEVRISVSDLGATLVSFFAPDKNGRLDDILLGFDSAEEYIELTDYQGAIAGPYANRIGGGRFSLDGEIIRLVCNENGKTCLHSNGEYTFALWQAEVIGESSVCFSLKTADGLNGFPGNITTTVTYSLLEGGVLDIAYKSVSSKKTVLNPTNHAYFNLAGYQSDSILEHKLMINAHSFTPVDCDSIPTGELRSVEGTPFDFTQALPIGLNIDADCEQLKFTGGYDHNFCIDGYDGLELQLAAVVTEAQSGRRLTVKTNLPGVQFYAGNFLKGTKGKGGIPMEYRSGFCLETQFYPDSPNHANFPSCVFDAGEVYESRTQYIVDLIG